MHHEELDLSPPSLAFRRGSLGTLLTLRQLDTAELLQESPFPTSWWVVERLPVGSVLDASECQQTLLLDLHLDRILPSW
jgi:hypothetical protein